MYVFCDVTLLRFLSLYSIIYAVAKFHIRWLQASVVTTICFSLIQAQQANEYVRYVLHGIPIEMYVFVTSRYCVSYPF